MTRRSLLVLAVASLLAACAKKAAPAEKEAAPPVVTDDQAGLMLTWIDEKGEFHEEEHARDVPADAREWVRVVDVARDPRTDDRIFVADLRTKNEAGAYPVRLVARSEFEGVAVKRRSEHGSVLSPTPAGADAASSAAVAQARPQVIIYGASWCGPCHQAADYLKKLGVVFVLKDIEQDEGAGREMTAKLAKAGRRGGSIPVIDVGGQILVGFDPGSVDRALARLR